MSIQRIASLSVLAFAAVSFAARPAHAQLSFRYDTYEVPGANPIVGSIAYGISASGDIVGTYLDDAFVYHGYVRHANGTFINVDYPGNIGTDIQNTGYLQGSYMVGGINSAGYATGDFYYFDAQGNHLAFDYFVRNGVYTTPDIPGKRFVSFININETGQVATQYSEADDSIHSTTYDLNTDTFTPIPDIVNPATGLPFFVSGINSAQPNGDLIGTVHEKGAGPSQGVYIHNGVTTFLSYPGAPHTRATTITTTGLISGNYDMGDDDVRTGFIYDTVNNHWYPISIPGAVNTELKLGNSDTQFVGWWIDTDSVYHSLIVTIVAHTVTGKLTFEGIAANTAAQNVTFELRPVGSGATLSQTLSIPAGGDFTFPVPSQNYTLWIKGDKYLAATVPVDGTNGNVTGVTATLHAGDGNNDNTVDIADFDLLVNAYNSSKSVANSGCDVRADFNGDGLVDVGDFGLLVNSHNQSGAPSTVDREQWTEAIPPFLSTVPCPLLTAFRHETAILRNESRSSRYAAVTNAMLS